MSYINSNTWEAYHDEFDYRYNQENCFEVDENLVLCILELNKKGYKTKHCCSGHMFDRISTRFNGNKKMRSWNNECYISFDDKVDFKTLPERFFKEVNNKYKTITIRKFYFSKEGTIERQKEIHETILDLYKWIESLEVISNEL